MIYKLEFRISYIKAFLLILLIKWKSYIMIIKMDLFQLDFQKILKK